MQINEDNKNRERFFLSFGYTQECGNISFSIAIMLNLNEFRQELIPQASQPE